MKAYRFNWISTGSFAVSGLPGTITFSHFVVRVNLILGDVRSTNAVRDDLNSLLPQTEPIISKVLRTASPDNFSMERAIVSVQ